MYSAGQAEAIRPIRTKAAWYRPEVASDLTLFFGNMQLVRFHRARSDCRVNKQISYRRIGDKQRSVRVERLAEWAQGG